jgi:hypothetical protein
MTAAPRAKPPTARYPVADLRAYLMGAWRVERALDDRRRGAPGSFAGEAVFRASAANALAYREEGRLALGGYETLAHQSYHYAFPAPHLAPHRAEVRFADGRPFHPLDLSGGRWTAEHACGADLYRGRFEALGCDRWTAEWEIVGPRKDQVLSSRFTRAA